MPYQRMSDDEAWAFLASDPPHTGKLATTRADGRPHVAPIWFVVDDRSIVFTTGADTAKGQSLRRDPRVALCVDDERPPFSFVTVEGEIEIDEAADDLLTWTTRLARRYLGDDAAEAYGRRNAVPGEMLCRLRPDRIVSARDVAD